MRTNHIAIHTPITNELQNYIYTYHDTMVVRQYNFKYPNANYRSSFSLYNICSRYYFNVDIETKHYQDKKTINVYGDTHEN